VIAPKDSNSISRQLALLRPIGLNQLSVKNLCQNSVSISRHPPISPGEERTIPLPFEFTFLDRSILVESKNDLPSGLVPDHAGADEGAAPAPAGPDVEEEFARWAQVVTDMARGFASREELFRETARCVLQMVRLDVAAVLLRNGSRWEPQAVEPSAEDSPRSVSPRPSALAALLQRKATVWRTPTREEEADWSSIADMRAVVAAPLLDPQGGVVGAIYGERTLTSLPTSHQTKLESMLLGLVAALVAAKLAACL
jgi:adenylate cyclase